MCPTFEVSQTSSATSIQGINNVNTATHHSVSIHLRSRRTDWHTSLTCAVVTNITSNSPATRLDTSSWNLPSDILLADEHFDRPSAIDLLIGADLFFEILLSNQRTRKGYPVLQETVLGWIVSGETPAVNPSNNNQRRRGCTKPQDDVKESDCSIACTLSAAPPALLLQHRLHTFGSIACTSFAASPAHFRQHRLHFFCSIACTLSAASPAHFLQHSLHFCSIACTILNQH